jgi:hypothetical protein
MLSWFCQLFLFLCSILQNDSDGPQSKRNSLTASRSGTLKHSVSLALERQGGTLKPHQSVRLQKRISMYSRTSHSRVNFGEPTDDVHLCIMCLRAIMNHQVCMSLSICSVSSVLQCYVILSTLAIGDLESCV